jgi:hypothetical protein
MTSAPVERSSGDAGAIQPPRSAGSARTMPAPAADDPPAAHRSSRRGPGRPGQSCPARRGPSRRTAGHGARARTIKPGAGGTRNHQRQPSDQLAGRDIPISGAAPHGGGPTTAKTTRRTGKRRLRARGLRAGGATGPTAPSSVEDGPSATTPSRTGPENSRLMRPPSVPARSGALDLEGDGGSGPLAPHRPLGRCRSLLARRPLDCPVGALGGGAGLGRRAWPACRWAPVRRGGWAGRSGGRSWTGGRGGVRAGGLVV